MMHLPGAQMLASQTLARYSALIMKHQGSSSAHLKISNIDHFHSETEMLQVEDHLT